MSVYPSPLYTCLRRGFAVVVSLRTLEDLEQELPSADAVRLASAYNRDAVGTLDRFVCWIGESAKPEDLTRRDDLKAVASGIRLSDTPKPTLHDLVRIYDLSVVGHDWGVTVFSRIQELWNCADMRVSSAVSGPAVNMVRRDPATEPQTCDHCGWLGCSSDCPAVGAVGSDTRI